MDMNIQDGGRRAIGWQVALLIIAVGIPSAGFVAVSGVFNGLFAWSLGATYAERSAWLSASLCVTALVAGLPIAIELIKHGNPTLAMQGRALWLAVVLFSITAALGFSASTREQHVASADAAQAARAGLTRELERLNARIDAAGSQRPPEVIEAEANRYLASNPRMARWTRDCTKLRYTSHRRFCAPYQALMDEARVSRATETLAARVDTLRAQLDGRAVVASSADPQAEIIVWLTHGLIGEQTIRRSLSVYVALIIELGAAIGLSVTAGSIAALMQRQRHSPPPAVEAAPVQLLESENLVTAERGFDLWRGAVLSLDTAGRVRASDAFNQYLTWAAANAYPPLSLTVWGRKMTEAVTALGGSVAHSNGRVYTGVSIGDAGSSGEFLSYGG